ncbi:MAG: comFC, partial [Caulobacteraceae bacterium]|nr:comFC [Caulobacteraceae bacterium]
YLPDALVRRRQTESQGGKSGGARRRNVAGAFHVPAGRADQVAGRTILLVDDVMTTGATLEGCARALKAAGATRVSVAVVARVKEVAGLTI